MPGLKTLATDKLFIIYTVPQPLVGSVVGILHVQKLQLALLLRT
jgi:hypothetical protein